MIKNKHKIVLCILGIIAVIFGVRLLLKASPHPLVPTEDISQNQAIGGSPKSPEHATTPAPNTAASQSSSTTPRIKPADFTARTTPANAPSQTPASPTRERTNEYQYHALGVVPNDPYYNSEWQLQKINTAAAWNTTTGTQVIVADIDTGYALQHEDLKNSWYISPGESGTTKIGDKCWTGTAQDKSTNNCDDDGNGYIDDWRGWNFYGRYQPTATPCAPDGMGTYVENNNPQAGQSGDDIIYQEYATCTGTDLGSPYAAISHGTSTAGLVGATSNNAIGIASLNWNTKIMPLQALGDDGSGWTSDISRAIIYAVDNGAQIINMSLGGAEIDTTLQNAINYAYQHNVVVVAAAGNCGTGGESGCDPTQPGQMLYPALYPHVISVGATTQTDTLASFSSYGRGLDVVAPGYGPIVSTIIDTRSAPFNYINAYSGSLAGTSFSSPLVASLASLIRSVRPTSTADDINAIIIANTRRPAAMNGALYTTQYGHGIVDASTAAIVAQSLQTQSSAPVFNQTGNFQSEHTYNANDTLSSGCTATSNSYCTVRWTEPTTGFERYLPYKPTNSIGQAGWQWSGGILSNGEWWGSALSGGNQSSNDYLLLAK